jgi:hypothetical protein
VEDTAYTVFQREMAVDAAWLGMVAKGDWRGIAQWLGEDREPVFYEATHDPHAWDGPSALHMMYFESAVPAADKAVPPVTVADAVASFGQTFSAEIAGTWTMEQSEFFEKFVVEETDDGADDDSTEFRPNPPRVPIRVFNPASRAQSAYEYYRELGGFSSGGNVSPPATWRQIHKDEITGGVPGSLYNTSYAIRREEVERAIPAMARAIENLPMSFVFTLRFVSGPKGTMAFTRFPECAVIEIDGLSPWICERAKLRLDPRSSTYQSDLKLLKLLRRVLPAGARELKHALNAVGVDFSNHFAKRSFLDKTKIQRDFGPLTDPASRLASWRRTREELLATEHGKAIFWNWGAVNFGLLDAPDRWPADIPTHP